MKHTKEPWQYISNKDTIFLPVIKSNELTLFVLNNLSNEEDAKRIVACINACAGLTNEQLESGYIQNLISDYNRSLVMAKELTETLEGFLKEYKDESL